MKNLRRTIIRTGGGNRGQKEEEKPKSREGKPDQC